jgi:hypothetical protein
MAARLGRCLYRLGCVFSGIILAIDLLAAYFVEPHDPYYTLALLCYALLALLIGWGCRRILSSGGSERR